MGKNLYHDCADDGLINQFVDSDPLGMASILEKSRKKKKKKRGKKGKKKIKRRLRALEKEQLMLKYFVESLSKQQSNRNFLQSDWWQKATCTVLPKGLEIIVDRLLAKK